MSKLNNLKRSGLFLLTAATLCFSSGKSGNQKDHKNDVDYLFSEEHKEVLFNEIINGTVPKDALAKPVDKLDTTHAINADQNGVVLIEQLRELYKKHPQDAQMSFTQNGQSYAVSAKDIIDLDDKYGNFMDKVSPGFDRSMIITKEDMTKVSVDYDQESKLAFPQITTASLIYMNKTGLTAALAHETGHIKNLPNPHNDPELQRKNEFRSDSIAANLVSPKNMIELLKQMATAYQMENRAMPLDSMKKYLNSTESFGFANVIAGTHPGTGRRVQYMEMFEIYKAKNEMNKLTTPAEQPFTFKNNSPSIGFSKK